MFKIDVLPWSPKHKRLKKRSSFLISVQAKPWSSQSYCHLFRLFYWIFYLVYIVVGCCFSNSVPSNSVLNEANVHNWQSTQLTKYTTCGCLKHLWYFSCKIKNVSFSPPLQGENHISLSQNQLFESILPTDVHVYKHLTRRWFKAHGNKLLFYLVLSKFHLGKKKPRPC